MYTHTHFIFVPFIQQWAFLWSVLGLVCHKETTMTVYKLIIVIFNTPYHDFALLYKNDSFYYRIV